MAQHHHYSFSLHIFVTNTQFWIRYCFFLQSDVQEVMCVIIKDREYPFDFISRIARNTSIGKLQIEVCIHIFRCLYIHLSFPIRMKLITNFAMSSISSDVLENYRSASGYFLLFVLQYLIFVSQNVSRKGINETF